MGQNPWLFSLKINTAGTQVGILANNNVIFPQEAKKAAQFISLCNLKYFNYLILGALL